MIATKLTETERTNFQAWLDANVNNNYSFDANAVFNSLENFTEDFYAHYEIPKHATKSGNPEIYRFDKSSFEFENDAD